MNKRIDFNDKIDTVTGSEKNIVSENIKSPMINRDIERQCLNIVKHVQDVSCGNSQIILLGLYFKIDNNGKIWLVACNKLRLREKESLVSMEIFASNQNTDLAGQEVYQRECSPNFRIVKSKRLEDLEYQREMDKFEINKGSLGCKPQANLKFCINCRKETEKFYDIKLKFLISNNTNPDPKTLEHELTIIEKLWGIRYSNKNIELLKNKWFKDLESKVCMNCYYQLTTAKVIGTANMSILERKNELKKKVLQERYYNHQIEKVVKIIQKKKHNKKTSRTAKDQRRDQSQEKNCCASDQKNETEMESPINRNTNTNREKVQLKSVSEILRNNSDFSAKDSDAVLEKDKSFEQREKTQTKIQNNFLDYKHIKNERLITEPSNYSARNCTAPNRYTEISSGHKRVCTGKYIMASRPNLSKKNLVLRNMIQQPKPKDHLFEKLELSCRDSATHRKTLTGGYTAINTLHSENDYIKNDFYETSYNRLKSCKSGKRSIKFGRLLTATNIYKSIGTNDVETMLNNNAFNKTSREKINNYGDAVSNYKLMSQRDFNKNEKNYSFGDKNAASIQTLQRLADYNQVSIPIENTKSKGFFLNYSSSTSQITQEQFNKKHKVSHVKYESLRDTLNLMKNVLQKENM